MASDYEKGMIDLSMDTKQMGKPINIADTHYPTIHIEDNYALDDLPDGEFYAVVRLKVTRHTEEDPVEGEGGCSCDIAVMGLKPMDGAKAKPKTKNSEEMLDDALDSIAQKKADYAEDAQDDGADEDTEK